MRAISIRLVDDSPALNVQRAYDVGVVGVAALPTPKLGLRRTVVRSDVATGGAGLGSVGARHEYNRHAGQRSLVAYLPLQVIERPTVESVSLTASNRDPLPDTLQLFKRKAATLCLSRLNDLLRHRVIGGMRKIVFSATGGLLAAAYRVSRLPALSTLRSRLLECFAGLKQLRASFQEFLPAVEIAVTVCRDVFDSTVNAQEVGNIHRDRCFNLTGRKQVEIAADKSKMGLTLLCSKKPHLPFAADEGNLAASGNGRDRNLALGQDEAKNLLVVSDGPQWSELPLLAFVNLVGVGNFGNQSDRKFRRQTKQSPHLVINQLVDGILTQGLSLPRFMGNMVARSVDSLHRLAQSLRLLCRRLEFDLCGKFHYVQV